MNTLPIFLILILLSSFPSSAAIDTTTKLDTVIVLAADFDADGVNDTLCYRITGASWRTPFKVTYTISSGARVIFKKTYNDKSIDEEFGGGSLDWCGGDYLECKATWYLTIMKTRLIRTVGLNDKRREQLFDTTSDASIPAVLKKLYEDSLQYKPAKADETAAKLVKNLKQSSFSCLVLPLHPLYASYPMLYDPVTRKFVTLIGF